MVTDRVYTQVHEHIMTEMLRIGIFLKSLSSLFTFHAAIVWSYECLRQQSSVMWRLFFEGIQK